MKKKFFVQLVLIIILSMTTITAFAGPPDDDVGGTWCYTPIMKEEIHGKNIFVYIEDVGEWTGTFSGVSKDIGTTIIHTESGKWNYHAIVSFEEVIVNGNMGTLEMRVTGKLDGAEWEGHCVITGSGGDLSGLKGQGTWWGPGYNPSVPDQCGMTYYSGKIHQVST